MEADEELVDRMCIVTRTVLDESALIRFVRDPQGKVVPDLNRSLPGRGVWVSLARSRVAEAQKRGLFSRGFKSDSQADAGLPGLVTALLRKKALGYLSFGKKAGEVVAGFTKCEDMLRKDRARLLLHAREAAEDGRRKLAQAAGSDVSTIELFEGAEMDLALGRSHVVHAAVAKGGLAEKLLAAVRRIEAYEAN
jgi:predicted RNA-binding protein YlxR (DUF448 family)/ribosomal protein L30E